MHGPGKLSTQYVTKTANTSDLVNLNVGQDITTQKSRRKKKLISAPEIPDPQFWDQGSINSFVSFSEDTAETHTHIIKETLLSL